VQQCAPPPVLPHGPASPYGEMVPVSGDGVRVGNDVVLVADVRRSIERFGDRYLRRVFTEHELSSCEGEPTVVAARLAARFAAKEAVVKVLRPTDVRPPWTDIEVRRAPEGACDLRLHGLAARMADDAGISSLAVSLSHEGDIATAVVVALIPTPTQEEPAA
jgi:holo-[acyl-carrier protein] synthase